MDERFRKIYLQETKELLQDTHQILYTLQKNPNETRALEEFFGTIHTLKSSTLEMGYSEVADLLHKVEDILQDSQHHNFVLTDKLLTYLFSIARFLDDFVEKVEKKKECDVDTEDLLSQAIGMRKFLKEEISLNDKSNGSDQTGLSLFSKKIGSIRVGVERIDSIVNLIGELIIAKSGLLERVRTYQEDSLLLNRAKELDRLALLLQDSILSSRLIPLEYAVNRFPGLVRFLCSSSGKDVDLTMEGQDIELDRTILDGVSEPLVHIVKNAVDHGIESKEERKKKKKHPIAKLRISARRERNQCVIEISDDGRGIDIEEILKKAAIKMPLNQEDALQMAVSWIFRPGFSTVKTVTEVSGRGVGLGFVKQRVESLGGKIKVESVLDEGTTFIIRLPLTMAIVQALLIKEDTECYAIPLTNVERSLDLSSEGIYEVDGFPLINVQGRVIRLFKLGHLFKGTANLDSHFYKGVEGDNIFIKKLNVVILRDYSVGLVVDELLGKREVFVKALDKLTSCVPILSGATILEDGRPAFILDVNNLVSCSNEATSFS